MRLATFIDEFSPGATLGFGARGLATALSFQTPR